MNLIPSGSGGLLAGYRFDQAAYDLHLLLPDPYTFPSKPLIAHLNTVLLGQAAVVDGLLLTVCGRYGYPRCSFQLLASHAQRGWALFGEAHPRA
ncbi:hypothetical protein A5705_21275 [Mycobacterium sp. E787]|nr:hypothetical protein A5705_21275 [Mycobacterium sp. E787]